MERTKKPFEALRRLILAHYNTMADFASDMSFSNATLSNKLNNKTPWRLGDINKTCELLNIPKSDIPLYFLP